MTDLSSFAGKYAVVTGGTQGLGETTAQLFARRGAAGILLVGRNAERGKAVAAEIASPSCRVVFQSADLEESR